MEKNWQASAQVALDDADAEELNKGTQDLFELLERLQKSRLDDQRCVLPSSLQLPVSVAESHHVEDQQLTSEVARSDSDLLRKVLESDGPYPMVLLPPSGGYRLDAEENLYDLEKKTDVTLSSELPTTIPSSSTLLEIDETATLYRRHFCNMEHYNFIMNDSSVGPIVMSVKYENINSQEHLRIILRRKHDIISHVIPLTFENESLQALKIAKILCDDITTEKFFAVLFPKASELIMAFDEHGLVNKMKFGVIYQKPGQTTEEEMFGNEVHSKAMEEFLQLLGEKIELRGFTGFRGGLDTHDGLTGDYAFYTQFQGVEIMFHVSTLLPYSRNDPQQLQRKRHIGNDVVAIVFQDENTPFMPSMIASHFLHTFIVVQVIDPLSANTRYKVSVTFRDDVPAFGPQLPSPPVFKKSEEFRTFFLTKLINAEIASLKAKKFVSLERRTRNSLLQALYDNLLERTLDFCGFSVPSDHNKSEIGTSSGFFDSVRKALSGRNRSHSVESNLAHAIPKRSSSRASNSSLTGTLTGDTTPSTVRAQSSQIIDSSSLQSSFNRDSPKDDTDPSFSGHLRFGKRTNSNPENFLPNSGTPPPLQPTMSESDSSSMNSLELERPIAPEDSDTGSNTEVLVQDILPAEVCEHEIAKLKIEKLNLLKEISVCQMEMKRLKANEIRLSTELSVMKQENKRLTEALLRLQVAHDTIV